MTTEYVLLDALVTTLQTITGLKFYHYPEPNMATPCGFALLSWPVHQSFDGRAGPVDGEIVVLTAYGVGLSRDGAKTLSEYVSLTGSRSIPVKLGAPPDQGGNPTLGGVIQDTRVSEVSKPKLYTFAPPDTKAYWGRSIICTFNLKP